MTQEELTQKLEALLQKGRETEVVEFKEAKNNYDFDKLGKYFSALSNEANLMHKTEAWLVFGVRDNDLAIVGSQFRTSARDLHHLKEEIAQYTTNRLSFVEIHEIKQPEGRVVLFQIPVAPCGIPTAWKGHFYGREGEALHPLTLSELDRIRVQTSDSDWSMGICKDASLQDLHPEAIQKAREAYAKKNPNLASEIATWDDATFLNKAKLLINGQITRAAIILLGTLESDHYISPAQAKITWILRDRDGIEKDYEHFGCPLFLNAEKAFQKIRNLKYRYIREQTLFPEEVDSYDPYVIREALHNCIAHQDYRLGGVIRLVESENSTLTFSNMGDFIPGTIERVIQNDSPESVYRNSFLAQAMVSLGMIDTIGSGIRRMFVSQKNRFFPLPEYSFDSNQVKVSIQGKILDMNYARKLAQMPELTLGEIFLLDKVQKGDALHADQVEQLRTKGLVEGRRPNIHISASIAKMSDQKDEYMKLRGIDNDYCRTMILDYIERLGEAKRSDIEGLLIPKLPDVLSKTQKSNKIKNILQELRVEEKIEIQGKVWKMSKPRKEK